VPQASQTLTRDMPMSTKEENVDILIADYEKHRKNNPKSKLPEVSDMNRKFLIDCNKLGSNDFLFSQELLPVEGYVFLGSWHRKYKGCDRGLRNSTWFKCNVSANYEYNDLTGARFISCQLNMVSFVGSNLTDVVFDDCYFDRGTMSGAIYENVKVITPKFLQHEPMHDDLDRVKFGWKSGLFDWAKLRILSNIPMFSISWSTFLGSLAIMNMIGWGSSNRGKLTSIVDPLTIPTTLIQLSITASCLMVASTLYNFCCPPRIKEISETEWTDKQHQPRLAYYSHRFPYRWPERAAILTIYVFGSIGISLTLLLVIDRSISAHCFATNWETPEQCEAPQILQLFWSPAE
jgi:hypothetical protein